MATDYERQFWNEQEQYHDFVKKYESGITYTHPNGATCLCGSHCPWAASRVKYYDYRGPRVTHL